MGRYRCGYIVSCNELSDYLPMDESGHNCCASKIVIAEEVSIIISWNSNKLITAKRGLNVIPCVRLMTF